MARTALVALLAATVGVAATLLAVGTTADAQQLPRVTCTQVPQKPGQLDEQYVANFMSEQLGAGRTHFTSVTGVSTVLCGW
jgi:nitrous oxide reductase